MGPNGWGGSALTGGAAPPGQNGAGTVTCNGMITVTFTWNNQGDPNSVPPDAVIIKQISTASWDGDSGSCANGIGDAAVTQPGGGAVSTGTKYTSLLNPGPTFQITCSPSASASAGEANNFGPPVGGSATVAYTARAYAVRLTLMGVVQVGEAQHILIGQKFTASVTFETGSPTSASDTFTWTLPGGDPFANYVAPTPAGPAVYTAFQLPTGPTLSCYFADPAATISVQCAITLPSAEGLSLTLSKALTSAAPDYDFDYVIQGSQAQIATVGGTYGMFFWGAIYQGNPWGIWWIGQVTTPMPWSASGYGSWGWTQLATSITTWFKHSNGNYYDWSENFTTASPPRLDRQHPYPGSFYTANGTWQVSGDAPGMPNNPDHVQLYAKDYFKTYQLYKPPGGDTRFVPLRMIAWNWLGHASRNSVNAPWSISQNGPNGATYLADFGPHPVWTRTAHSSNESWILRK